MGNCTRPTAAFWARFAYDNFGNFLLDKVSRNKVLLNTPAAGWTPDSGRSSRAASVSSCRTTTSRRRT